MDIPNLVNILNSLDNQDLDMRLYFTRKKPNGRYQSYSPTIDPGLQIQIKDIVKEAIENVQDVEQRPFSPVGTIEGCIETYTPNEVASFNDILESISDELVNRQKIPTEEIGFESIFWTQKS